MASPKTIGDIIKGSKSRTRVNHAKMEPRPRGYSASGNNPNKNKPREAAIPPRAGAQTPKPRKAKRARGSADPSEGQRIRTQSADIFPKPRTEPSPRPVSPQAGQAASHSPSQRRFSAPSKGKLAGGAGMAIGLGAFINAEIKGRANAPAPEMASQSTSVQLDKRPSGNNDLTEVRVNAKRRNTPSTPTGGTPKVAPQARSGGSSGGSSRGRTMKGKELADWLGLDADSAVRYNIETGGKQKYPVRGVTSGIKSGKGRTKVK